MSKMIRFSATLTGLTPLLMHADDLEQMARVDASRSLIKSTPDLKDAFKAGDDRVPADTWKAYLYTSGPTGNLVIPSDNILKALAFGGKYIAHEKRGTKSKKVATAIICETGTDLPLLVAGKTIPVAKIESATAKLGPLQFTEMADAVRGLDFRLFVKRAKIGMSKHVRVRPRFDQWSITGEFACVTEDFDRQSLELLFSKAGLYAGLGDWRPSSPMAPGAYGKFEAKLKFDN